MDTSTETGDTVRQRAEMAALLGLDEPVSEQVFEAAIADETYAHHLLTCREEPAFLQHLLAHPPARQPAAQQAGHDTATLLRGAAQSLARWAKTGFSTVGAEVYQRRLAACGACPYLRKPPAGRNALLYAIAGAAADEQGVCGQCGCVVAVKARRSSDTCPASHPDTPGVNRWNEPLAT
ncbi:hypothetical protein K8353_01395 [Burkholderia contaminans]|nr:hypothetical protein [Burkholderia contaminans]